ncbi:MAG: alpha/beta hydrolase, partial [Acidimicrobiales bacterium]|nr:alpha/beta hydrolase [Acidimicrobiales bacterium]
MSSLRVIRRDPTTPGPAGSGSVVLVHGAMDRASSFTRLMAKLPDWTRLAYDRRGYAGSAETGPPSSFAEQVEDLLAVLEQNPPRSPPVAFGHSFGGDVVLAALAEHPTLFSAAVVWEPPQPWLPWWPNGVGRHGPSPELEPEERAEWFMRRMVGDRIWERLPSSTRARRRAEGATLDAELQSLSNVPALEPRRIGVPVIVGRGGRSWTYQRRGVEELAAALPRG